MHPASSRMINYRARLSDIFSVVIRRDRQRRLTRVEQPRIWTAVGELDTSQATCLICLTQCEPTPQSRAQYLIHLPLQEHRLQQLSRRDEWHGRCTSNGNVTTCPFCRSVIHKVITVDGQSAGCDRTDRDGQPSWWWWWWWQHMCSIRLGLAPRDTDQSSHIVLTGGSATGAWLVEKLLVLLCGGLFTATARTMWPGASLPGHLFLAVAALFGVDMLGRVSLRSGIPVVGAVQGCVAGLPMARIVYKGLYGITEGALEYAVAECATGSLVLWGTTRGVSYLLHVYCR